MARRKCRNEISHTTFIKRHRNSSRWEVGSWECEEPMRTKNPCLLPPRFVPLSGHHCQKGEIQGKVAACPSQHSGHIAVNIKITLEEGASVIYYSFKFRILNNQLVLCLPSYTLKHPSILTVPLSFKNTEWLHCIAQWNTASSEKLPSDSWLTSESTWISNGWLQSRLISKMLASYFSTTRNYLVVCLINIVSRWFLIPLSEFLTLR